MRMTRFYCDPALSDRLSLGAIVLLPDNAAVHAVKVLRMNQGDSLILFNGDGQDYRAEILQISKQQVRCKILSVNPVNSESPLQITLAQAISAGDRMDFTIQKAVELGVAAIQPIASQRSVVKLSQDRLEKRLAHWKNVANAACEQSGRAIVPQVFAPLSLADWLAQAPLAPTRIMLSPDAEIPITKLQLAATEICLLVGAEGGLSPEEKQLASLTGFQSVRMGTRVLRTETAPLAALAAIQTLWGDFSA